MSQKRKRSPEPQSEPNVEIFRSAPIEDRSSTFIGLFSPSLKPKHLQRLEEISSASHKILGHRRESNQQPITGGVRYVTDHDDDGEKYAGKRVAKVLDSMQVTGTCVVARWYGGVLLGPVRFEHIENCAKEAVRKWQDLVAEERSKRRKEEEDATQKAKLVKVLAERDQSVTVLRTLAAETEAKVKRAKAPPNTNDQDIDGTLANGNTEQQPKQSSAEVKPEIDYTGMPLERLKALEKARDATLSFLLKRIDKAEAELAARDDEKG